MANSFIRIASALLVVSLLVAGFWAVRDRPLSAPDWSGTMRGVSYSPSHIFSESELDTVPPEQISADLEQLKSITSRVRTYTVDRGFDIIPAEARKLGMTVSLGIWLGADPKLNDIEIAKALDVINAHPGTIDRVFVGNEVVLRGDLTATELAAHIARVNRSIPARIEVGTADVWSVWIDNPELATPSEFVGVHLLPYWEGVPLDEAMAYIEDRRERVANLYPTKPFVIAETGWPSEGRMRGGSVPSPAMAAAFLRQFLDHAAQNRYDYYIIEAFDQPWKIGPEGAVGAFWGVFDARGDAKYTLTGTLTSFAQWPVFALMSAMIVLGLGALLLATLPVIRFAGYLAFSLMLGMVVLAGLVIFDSSALKYADPWTLAVLAIIVPTGGLAAAFILTETAEFVSSLWRRQRSCAIPASCTIAPFVSVHVPTHNEPAQVVMRTVQQLAALDYPNFEVIVLDNNTADPELWRPVEDFCAALGPRFRFFHMDGVRGFKAGALNAALGVTDARAEIIAVIDCDYRVEPHWLKTIVPGFVDNDVAVVQAPQDYRDAGESPFKTMTYEEYATFFHVGMVERNEYNAIVQHGTMTAVRRSALEQVGGWAEWCITEDTELGLRLLEAGYRCLYVPSSMGRGLMPDTFAAYKAQRHRWVYGAMQILKRHLGALLSPSSTLTAAQRYQFLAGWLPWLADAAAVVFLVSGLIWSALMIIAPKQFDVPMMALSAIVLLLFATKVTKTLWLHAAKTKRGFGAAVSASVAALGLSWTVSRAVWSGLFTSSQPFLRTPKREGSAAVIEALSSVRMETLLFLLGTMAGTAVAMTSQTGDIAATVWVAALTVQVVPHGVAIFVAIVSAMSDHQLAAPFEQDELIPSAG
jgi:exo-beta-1,3-glucanase (GH17 family)/cellulose synthase/poly-beta-1,6-N-acetylglucosamine synthase-like glycosyltransferase